jgi:uncharacterized membrane-anchored protein YitT (DUF2179 family)
MKFNKKIRRPRFKYPVLTTLKMYAIISIGLFINALAWTAFLIPSEIVGGGVTGISALVFYATGQSIPIGVTFLLINAALLLVSMKSLGLRFGIKTIYAIVVLSFFFTVLSQFFTEPIVSERFMSAIIGGILAGVSIGIVFTQGGSTGGTDIIAMIINKYRNISPGRILLLLDVVIISSSYLVFQSIEVIVYGYVTMAVTSYSIDMLLMGHRQSVQLFIFSRKHDEIAQRIANDIGRGVTLLKSKGWYSKEEGCLLMVVVKRHETSEVYRTIKEIDSEAFISVSNVMGVYGKGFDPIKH